MFNRSYVGKRPDILRMLPSNFQRVLDVGCSNGEVGHSIKVSRGGATVVGVELSPAMAEVASQRLDSVFCGTAEDFFLDSDYSAQLFDVIIFADVLEHMPDPWKVLAQARGRLTEGGSIIISLPNVRHVDTIYHLVFKGVWPYRDRGIHDRTHLRFFTWKNIVELLESSQLTLQAVKPTYRLIEAPHRFNRRFAWIRWLPGIRDFFVFQYVMRATRKPAGLELDR